MSESVTIRYWLRSDVDTWIPGVIKSQNDTQVSFKAENGEVISIPADQLKDVQHVSDDQLAGVDDVCSLVNVNEGALLWTVRRRYLKKLIYTRVARTIIAVNPFMPLPIYSSQTLEQYTTCTNSADLPPHIFAIGQDAIRGLRDSSNDQAVLISGESGAGKTESAKFIMSFVADAMRTSEGDRMEKVLRTNVVLEAFGNAMTVRNNNSSRFGKWLDLHFSVELQSLGATITSYLLETTRVVNQASKERGYHVFFQLLQARDKFPDLGLETPKKYEFLNKGLAKAPGINDERNFEELQQSLGHFGIDGSKQTEIWSILTIILLLGNVDFMEKGDGSDVVDMSPLEKLADLMEVDKQKFMELMTVRKVVVGKEVTKGQNRIDQARGVRDALARLLYGQLFIWLISFMNEKLTTRDHEPSDRLIGVLDIAGFECFEHNSLEQLLINLSNEHLQQHFNDSMIKSEEADCEKEGVILPQIEGFDDNADILTLIDTAAKGSPLSVLDILDETCLTKFSSANDLSFVGKVVKTQKDHKRLIMSKSSNKPVFGIKHFAGDVMYTCDGWLEKNMEKLPLDTADLFRSSGIELVTEISEAMGNTTPGGKGGRMKSVTGGFRASLKELMAKIHRANPHYIRCVKPNTAKEAGKFTPPLVMEQLLFGGMFAAVNIRQQGYAYRLPHKDFINLYACIAEQLEHVEAHAPGHAIKEAKPKAVRVTTRKSVVAVTSNALERARSVVEGLPAVLKKLGYDIGPENFALGHTKVFTKYAAVQPLDDSRQFALKSVATTIQATFRGYKARCDTAKRKKIQAEVQSLISDLMTAIGAPMKGGGRKKTSMNVTDGINKHLDTERMKNLMGELIELLKQAEALEFDSAIISAGDWVHRRLRRELSAIDTVEKLRRGVVVMEIEKALRHCTKLQLPDFPARQELTTRLAALEVQQPLIKALENALGVSTTERQAAVLQEVLKRVEDAGLREDAGRWLPELKGAELMNDVLSALAEALQATDAKAAADLAKEREKAQKEASEAAAAKAEAVRQEAQKALNAKTKEDQNFEQELAKQRAQMAQQFRAMVAKAVAEQKASVEAAVAEKLAAEHAKAEIEKERIAAQEAAQMVEKKLAQAVAAERAIAEEELARRLLEVSEQLMAERKAAEAVLVKNLAEERSKAELAQKQITERIEAERLAHEILKKALDDMESKEADFKKQLKDEREAVEEELAEKLKKEKALAEEELAERCRAEREAAAKETKEVKEKLEAEHVEAQRALEHRLYEEHKEAEKDLANRLIEKHAAAQQSFADQLAREKAAVQKEFEEKLAAEAAKAEAAQIIASKSAEELLAMEREKMEKDLAERLQQERLAAQNEFQKKLKLAEDEAHKHYDQRIAIEKRGRRSIPGLVMSERSQVLALLRTAETECDADSLEMLLNFAAEDGYDDSGEDGVLAAAKRKFEELQDPDIVEEYLENEEDNAEMQNPDLSGLVRLYNLLSQLRKLGAESDTKKASRKLQLALVTIASNKRLQSILETTDKEELELAQKVFGDLSNFSDLKPPADWAESGKAVFPIKRANRRTKSGKQVWGILDAQKASSSGKETVGQAGIDKEAFEKMLSHTRDCISESMTRVPLDDNDPDEYDSGASLNFINLTTYMTDKPAQECQRQACHDAVLELAKQSHMRDEVYCQVMKQLRNNPDGRSLRLGWDILYHLCSSTPPSPALCEFVRAFTKDQQKKLMAKPDTAPWAEEATNNVQKALGGSSLWKRVGDFWETVFWCVDTASGGIIGSYHPKLDEASAQGKRLGY